MPQVFIVCRDHKLFGAFYQLNIGIDYKIPIKAFIVKITAKISTISVK